ncbi:MAG TPA: hypothetical protein DCX12_07865 [Chloroflexi bacterium]|nr:hypothetical protein [Chloroflexota bacterium]
MIRVTPAGGPAEAATWQPPGPAVGPPGVGLGVGVAAATTDGLVDLEDGGGVDVEVAGCEPAPHPAIRIAVPARRVSATMRCLNGRGA